MTKKLDLLLMMVDAEGRWPVPALGFLEFVVYFQREGKGLSFKNKKSVRSLKFGSSGSGTRKQ